MTGLSPYTEDDVQTAIRAAARARYLKRWPGGDDRADRYADRMAADPLYRVEMTAALDALAAAGRIAPPNATTIATLAGHQRRITGLLVELAEVVTRTADLMDPPPQTTTTPQGA